MKETKRIIYPILLILAAMIWGFAFSAQKSADETPPLLLGTLRSVFAAVFLFFAIVIRDKIKGEKSTLFKKNPFSKYEIAGGVICGVTLAASNLFQQLGLNAGTDAGKASFITALYVLFVPIYALAIGKRPRMNAVISMLIALVGFYFLCITEQTTLAPSDLLVLAAALIFPIYILAIDKYSDRADALKISLIQFIVSALTSFIPSLFFEFPVPVGSVSQNILYIIILGVGSSGIAYTLQIIGQRGVPPTASSVLLSLESVFGVIGAMIFLGEGMSLREYIGSVILFLAVIISQIDISIPTPKKAEGKEN